MPVSTPAPTGIAAAIALLALGLGCFSGCAGHHHGRTGGPLRCEPFIRELPVGGGYVRLLEEGQSVVMRSGLVTLQPGENCGWHSTEDYEELIICLAGAGEVETDSGGRRLIRANHYAYNPPHTRHNVYNTGTEPLRYIYVVAPTRTE